jgi:hypothetical protein
VSYWTSLFVGPYAEWAVPVGKGPVPETPEWAWFHERMVVDLQMNLGELPELERDGGRYHLYRLMPSEERPGAPGRSMYFGGKASLGFGALDLTEVDRRAEVRWFAEAFCAELRQLADHVGAEPALRWGAVKWVS